MILLLCTIRSLSKKTKILRMAMRIPPEAGGMERHVERLSEEQIKLNYSVDVFFNRGEELYSNYYQVTKLPLALLRPQFIGIALFNFLALLRLIKLKTKYDILHIHGDWSSLLFSTSIKNLIGAKVIIVSIHDELSEKKIHNMLLKFLIKRVDVIFVTGYKAKRQIRSITDNNVYLQPSGIDEIFFSKKRRQASFNNNVAVVSNLAKKKNLGLVLDIASKLPDLKFFIAGQGKLKKHLSKRISIENIKNVNLLGFLDKARIKDLHMTCDIFLSTSLKEGTPTASLEAMASGLPIVTSNAGEVKQLLGNNFVIEDFCIDDYISSIKKIRDNPVIARKISESNLELAKKYTWANVSLFITKQTFEQLKKNE